MQLGAYPAMSPVSDVEVCVSAWCSAHEVFSWPMAEVTTHFVVAKPEVNAVVLCIPFLEIVVPGLYSLLGLLGIEV